METEAQLHTRLIREATEAKIAVVDLARAWASIDGKREQFEIGEFSHDIEAGGGHYAGYMCEAEELLRRATKYAKTRSN